MGRDDFSAANKDVLAKRVGYLCSNPACKQSTCGPQTQPTGTVNIGVAAHVAAASPGGPRYDESMSETERVSIDNGVWLCQTCAKLIDSDVDRFSVSRLQQWKLDAEAAASRALEYRRAPATESEGVFMEAERMMPDLIAEMRVDVRSDDTQLIREFVPLSKRGIKFNHPKPQFVYYKTDHPKLTLQLDWLKEMGLIIDVTPLTYPVYRMVPEFAKWLRFETGARSDEYL
ncbi:MAG: hypothetical protein HGA99_04060 [Chlorobiaceae bacterium]|nr:hypothetical protein [Chlorobiaceae bacterium]